MVKSVFLNRVGGGFVGVYPKDTDPEPNPVWRSAQPKVSRDGALQSPRWCFAAARFGANSIPNAVNSCAKSDFNADPDTPA